MKYTPLRTQMKNRLDDLKNDLSYAIDNNYNNDIIDELTEQIQSAEWQIECLEDQMFSDYLNY